MGASYPNSHDRQARAHSSCESLTSSSIVIARNNIAHNIKLAVEESGLQRGNTMLHP